MYIFFRLVESGDFGIVGRSADADEEALNTGRSALLTVTSATKSKNKGIYMDKFYFGGWSFQICFVYHCLYSK